MSLMLAGCAAHLGAAVDNSAATRRPALASSNVTPVLLLSIDTPIVQVAADPAGRAILERDLPGLLERPEYAMFKTMSLKKLAGLSGGKLTDTKLAKVQSDLAAVRRGNAPR